jgi:hypothetical protein
VRVLKKLAFLFFLYIFLKKIKINIDIFCRPVYIYVYIELLEAFMGDKTGDILHLRIKEKRKNWLQRLATNNNLTMNQWVQAQVVKAMWQAITETAEFCATEQTAEEFGVPEKVAMKLNKADTAILIIPAEKQAAFKKRVNELYQIYIKKDCEHVNYAGLEEELHDIDGDFTWAEWLESEEGLL